MVHRRGGKTVACVNDLIARALYTQKADARYAYLAPYYRQAKDVAWAYLKHYAKPVISKIRESELRVELINGSWITLYGADNPDALRGIYLDGAVLDEFGDTRPSLWGQVILPTLVDRKGWAVFIGTPKGKNHFFHIFKRSIEEEGWYNLTLKASESGIIPQEELDEIRMQMTDDEYEQEFECSFTAAVKGTYYSDQIALLEQQGHMDDAIVYQPNIPVEVAGDIGYRDSTALWFWQERPDGIAIIDYEEAHGKALPYYFDLLRTKPYAHMYKTIWLPHDARAKSLQTGKSTVEQFLEEQFPCKVIPKLDLQDGINAVRKTLPYSWFNATACYEGIEGLRHYRRKYDELNDAYLDTPVHDWASHPSDGFRYLALVARPGISHTAAAVKDPNLYGFTLDDLFEQRERGSKTYNTLRI